jgi:rubredoxin
MQKYECIGVQPTCTTPRRATTRRTSRSGHIAFEDLPDDWVCPDCGVGKDMFEPMD